MKDREVMVVFPGCILAPEDRILAKEKYDEAEQSETVPIGNLMLYAKYVMTKGLYPPPLLSPHVLYNIFRIHKCFENYGGSS